MLSRLMKNCPMSIRQDLAPSRPFVLSARNSDGSSAAGRRQTAQNAHVLVESLYEDQIIDLRGVIPSEAELMEMLKTTEDRVDQDRTSWRFVEWRSPDRSVVLLLGQGSGTKVNEQDLQVFMERVRLLIANLHPVALWTHHSDRLGRDEIGMIRLVRAVERNKSDGFPCEVGFARRGTLLQHDSWDIPVYFEARQARMQAEALYRRTRDAQYLQTETAMVQGRFRLSIALAPPPGLGRARLLDSRGALGSGVAYLDADPYRPHSDEVGEPLHMCLDDNGEPADQVANVQWALTEMANGRTSRSIASTLARRGFSTVALARRHRRGATYRSIYGEPDAKLASQMCRSITRSLDMYERGILETNVGGKILTVQDCMPPGGWISKDVATGVREWVRGRVSSHPHGTQTTALTGLVVTVDGEPYRLRPTRSTCSCDETARHG